MDLINKQTITIDFKQNTVAPVPHYTQFDSNTIVFVINDGGNVADLSVVNKITMNYKRPDGLITSRILMAVGNIITYEIGNEEMSVAGYGEMVLQFYFNDSRVSTKRIKLYFGESLGTSFEKSAGMPLLQELFVEVANSANEANEAGNYAMEKANELETTIDYLIGEVNKNVTKSGDTMTGTLEVPSIKTGSHTFEHHQIAGEDTELAIVKRDGDHYTILEVVAPTQEINGHAEATLTLMREVDPDTGSPDFLDLYNMNYPDGKQMGIRVQTRGGGGILRDFVFDFNRGQGIAEAMRIKPNKDIIYQGNARFQSANDQIIEFQDENGNRAGYFGRIVSTAIDRISMLNSIGSNSMELHDNGSFVVYSAAGDYYVYLDSGSMFVNDSKVQTQDLTTLRSPDGSVWKASIDDTGVVTWSK